MVFLVLVGFLLWSGLMFFWGSHSSQKQHEGSDAVYKHFAEASELELRKKLRRSKMRYEKQDAEYQSALDRERIQYKESLEAYAERNKKLEAENTKGRDEIKAEIHEEYKQQIELLKDQLLKLETDYRDLLEGKEVQESELENSISKENDDNGEEIIL
jgi:hypothetical protein